MRKPLLGKTILKFGLEQLCWTALPLFFILAGCATTVDLRVQRTPVLNTSGISRVAIMPFEAADSPVYQNAARYVVTTATSRFSAISQFTLVSPQVINDSLSRGEGIENYVDALFSGQIIRITENINTQEEERRDKENNIIPYINYIREVEVEFSYSFVRARDGSIIGPVVRRGRASDIKENRDSLEPVETLVNRIIDSQFRSFHRDVAPYTTTVSRTLEKDKNKAIKDEMNAALDLVKGNNYTAAQQAYLRIWQSHRSVAAAVNVSIFYEALGDTREAANFMEQVINETGSPLARDALARLNRELSEQAMMVQFYNVQNPALRAAAYAVGEIHKVLPAGARLLIHNDASFSRNLVNDAVDNITSGFLSLGVSVVERQMIDMVLREQNFQMEGHVSDDDFVSIGHLAGANIIVIVNITGVASSRRLQLRVLDIRTGSVILQSGTGSEWHL